MGYPKEVYDKAWETLSRRRQEARERTVARREEIHRTIPEIRQIEREMAMTASSVAKVVIADPSRAEEHIEELQHLNLTLQEKRQLLLQQKGYSCDYLAEQHGCDLCGDSGYVGIRMCACLRELLKKSAYASLGAVSQSANCTFQSFSLEYYPDKPVDASGVIPRQRMGQVLEACLQYARSFSRQSESLLLLGHTGLGKTHLSLAMAAAATEAGFGVVYTPVQKLMDRLESDKFSYKSEAKENYAGNMDYVLSCDLLVLDDLGTEFNTQFTGAVLYNIINSRLVENRPTIISTNLELNQIEEKYSQRMVSRLICTYKVLKFYGKDIRFVKKQQL